MILDDVIRARALEEDQRPFVFSKGPERFGNVQGFWGINPDRFIDRAANTHIREGLEPVSQFYLHEAGTKRLTW